MGLIGKITIKNKDITLYSSGLAMILASLLSWLMIYNQTPQNADVGELQRIVYEFEQIKTENNMTSDTNSSLMMAWLYPGSPACGALDEAQVYGFDVLKPEYFIIKDGGILELMTTDLYGCNGYSEMEIAKVRNLSKQQFVTISSSYQVDMDKFLQKDELNSQYTRQLVQFVLDNKLTGVEVDFEDFGGWSAETTKRYLNFVNRLGTALHQNGKQLMVDLPPVSNKTEEGWYKFKLTDFNDLPVDYIVIMAYDYQFDHGAGNPVAPLGWLTEVVNYTRGQVNDDNKIVIGLPSYGYAGDIGANRMNILTYEQALKNPLFAKVGRDTTSGELIARNGNDVLVVQDTESLNRKIETVRQAGINKISIWHLGGNKLPTNKY